MMRTRPEQAIPVAAAHEWHAQARRTAVIRFGLAGALLLAVAAAVSLGRDPAKRVAELFPGSESGVLVLDMSASVGSPGRLAVGPLEYLSRTGQEFGLVLLLGHGLRGRASWIELRGASAVHQDVQASPEAVPLGRRHPVPARNAPHVARGEAQSKARRRSSHALVEELQRRNPNLGGSAPCTPNSAA